MQLSEIERMISRGSDSEWVDLELKKSFAEKEAGMKTLCAFLNGSGGSVIFGVTPRGRIVGLDLTDQNLRDLADQFRSFEPAVVIQQEQVLLDSGRGLLVLQVQPVPGEPPYVFRGRPYIRNGSRTEVMPQSIYQQRLAERDIPRLRWETQIAEGVAISDLDTDEILRTARLGVEAGRVPEETTQSPAGEVLRKFHLMQDGSVLNAAVALFGKPDPIQYPQMRLHLAHFNGTTKDADMLDMLPPLEGHAFALLREAEDFLRRRLPQAGRLVPGTFERVDEPVFPLKALREVLANAFAHRDYGQAGGSVHVAIYTDRVEVTNPGALPPGMSLDDLLTEHESKPRNPLIAKVFFRRKLIDEWGRGTRAIVTLCRNAGHPDPEFFQRGGTFGVRLLSSVPLGPQAAEIPDLKPGEIAILRTLRRGEAPLRDLAPAVANITPRTVRAYLANLQKLGLVKNDGKRGVGAKWRIRGKGLDVLGALEAQEG